MSNLHPIFQEIFRHIAPPQPALTQLGIDVRTTDRQKLISLLRRVPGVFSVQSGGAYREGPEWSQVWLETTMSERELEDWLYAQDGIDYQGTFERNAA